jgi:hypothetical protein
MSLMDNSNFHQTGVPSTLVSPGCRKATRGACSLWQLQSSTKRREDAIRGTECGNPKSRKTHAGPDRALFATRMCDLYRTCADHSAPVYTVGGVGPAVLLQRRRAGDLHRDRPLSHDARRPSHPAEYRGLQLLQSFLVSGAQYGSRPVTDPTADQAGLEARGDEAVIAAPPRAVAIAGRCRCRKHRRHALPG